MRHGRVLQGLNKKRTVMIGDRMDTDIEFGRSGGVDTLVRTLSQAVSHLVLCTCSMETGPGGGLATLCLRA